MALLDSHQHAPWVQFLGVHLGCQLHAGLSLYEVFGAEAGLQGWRKLLRWRLAIILGNIKKLESRTNDQGRNTRCGLRTVQHLVGGKQRGILIDGRDIVWRYCGSGVRSMIVGDVEGPVV